MKKITTLLTLTLLLISFISKGQQHQHTERCGHVAAIEKMEAKYPGYSEAVNNTFEAAKLRSKEILTEERRMVYTVPVVIHVVYNQNSAEQNLADSIIENQMRILNEDFRLQNPDAGNIRPEFTDIQGDAMIEFELKEVKRVSHNNFLPFIPLLDNMKRSGEGGSDAVDPAHTLNIWVCEMLAIPGLGGVLGYAYPPANLTNWPDGAAAQSQSLEGVVIDYRAFASNNPATSFFEDQGFEIIGRTTTHEVGHYLGLRHYWGDAQDGEDLCAVDDGIDDTPQAATNSQVTGCDTTKNTCDEGENDLPDMWENYMDYSEETCQVAFTNGQIALMRAVLECPRVGLIDTTATTADLPVSGTPTGSTEVNAEATESYTVPTTNNDYIWEVTGGNITTGSGTNTIEITWGNGTIGKVCLAESNGQCSGIANCIDIAINSTCSAPTTGSITGSTNAEVATTEAYSVTNSGNTFTWTVTGGLIVSGDGTNAINVEWSNENTGKVCLVESDGSCDGNEVCLDVTLSVPTGIEEIAYNKALSVYPSPANSFINVVANEVPTRIEIIDVLGSVLASYENLQLNNLIEVSNLNTKVVFVKVQFDEGFAVEQIIIE